MSRTRLALIFTLLTPFLALAQTAPKIDQDQALKTFQADVDQMRQKLYVPGAALAVIKDDKIVLLTGLGYKDLKNKKPVTPDTLFAIGSCSKAFTSMLMAMAVDEGKVKWSDSPKKYLPYFRMRDPDTDAKITINDILSHRSGLPRTDFIMIGPNLTSEDLIWNVTRAKPTAKLGERWQYQNIMFVAAGMIEQQDFGKPWQQLVEDRIFNPLGMSRSDTSDTAMMKDPDHSLGYDGSPEMNELAMRPIDSAAPAGAINSSAREMCSWVRFLLRGGSGLEAQGSGSGPSSPPSALRATSPTGGDRPGGDRLVSQDSFEEIFRPHQTIIGKESYGYGWMLDDWNGHKVIQHGGNIDGFNAQVAMMPDEHLGMVLLTNVSGSPLGGYAMDSLWKNMVGEPADADKIVALQNPDQEVGTYRLELAKLDMVVTHEGDKLFVHPTGQPKMELLPLGNRRYKIAPPAPDKVYMTFMPNKDNPKQTVATLEQSGMKFDLTVAKPYQPTISVDDLMDKELAAMGGRENFEKLKSITYHYFFNMETQGVTTSGFTEKVAPDSFGEVAVYSTASGERFAWDSTAFDGTKGRIQSSYSPDITLTGGEAFANVQAIAFTSQELDWKKNFASVVITGEGKVNGEDAYEVTKKTKAGAPVMDYVSTKSFMLLKRLYGTGENQVSDSFSDYKLVGGIEVPMTILRDGLTSGPGTVTLSDVVVNGPVDEALIRVKI